MVRNLYAKNKYNIFEWRQKDLQKQKSNISFSNEIMAEIDWPMGISIKVQTPEEIAISILTKLIDVRNEMG